MIIWCQFNGNLMGFNSFTAHGLSALKVGLKPKMEDLFSWWVVIVFIIYAGWVTLPDVISCQCPEIANPQGESKRHDGYHHRERGASAISRNVWQTINNSGFLIIKVWAKNLWKVVSWWSVVKKHIICWRTTLSNGKFSWIKFVRRQ